MRQKKEAILILKKKVFSTTLLMITLLGAIFLGGCSTVKADQKPLEDANRLSPAEAASIALQEYPQSKVKAITLEEEDNVYYYQVSLLEAENEYALAIDLTTGQILANYKRDSTNDAPLLSFGAIAELAKNQVPEGKLMALSLETEDQFGFYKVSLLADATKHTLYYHHSSGEVIQTQEEVLAKPIDLSRYLTFEEATGKMLQLAPKGALIELQLDYDQPLATYEGTVLLEGQILDLEIDAKTGTLISQETEPLDPEDYPTELWPLNPLKDLPKQKNDQN